MIFTYLGYLLIPSLTSPNRAYELHGNNQNLGFAQIPSLKQMRQVVSVNNPSGFDDFSAHGGPTQPPPPLQQQQQQQEEQQQSTQSVGVAEAAEEPVDASLVSDRIAVAIDPPPH